MHLLVTHIVHCALRASAAHSVFTTHDKNNYEYNASWSHSCASRNSIAANFSFLDVRRSHFLTPSSTDNSTFIIWQHIYELRYYIVQSPLPLACHLYLLPLLTVRRRYFNNTVHTLDYFLNIRDNTVQPFCKSTRRSVGQTHFGSLKYLPLHLVGEREQTKIAFEIRGFWCVDAVAEIR
jgi:hypothetical protein